MLRVTKDNMTWKQNFTNSNIAYILYYMYPHIHTTADNKMPKSLDWEFLPTKGVISKIRDMQNFHTILFHSIPNRFL